MAGALRPVGFGQMVSPSLRLIMLDVALRPRMAELADEILLFTRWAPAVEREAAVRLAASASPAVDLVRAAAPAVRVAIGATVAAEE